MVVDSKKIAEIMKFESNILKNYELQSFQIRALRKRFENEYGFPLHDNLVRKSLMDIDKQYKSILKEIQDTFKDIMEYKAYMYFLLIEGSSYDTKEFTFDEKDKKVIICKRGDNIFSSVRNFWIKYFYDISHIVLKDDIKDKTLVMKQIPKDVLFKKEFEIETDLFKLNSVEKIVRITFKNKKQAKLVGDFVMKLDKINKKLKWDNWSWDRW